MARSQQTALKIAAQTTRPSDAILDRLMRLHPKGIDLTLGRIERLLQRLGHPERLLPPVVHVAGTNGKGSVIAYLRAMLEAAGHDVHVYTSPHLVRFHERVRLNGRLIDEALLSDLLEECEAANGEEPITFFEITTAAAFLAFARTPADILLLETGLGGRLDATNVIDRPLLSVITPVSIDHVQFLGETLEEIAFEKAGILKPDVPAVIAPQAGGAWPIIQKQAESVGAPLYRAGKEWGFAAKDGGFDFSGVNLSGHFAGPTLPGAHQIDNAACALACAALLSESGLAWNSIGVDALHRGLREAEWPGRLQRLSRGPLPALLPPGWELWLDGGHNAAAGAALQAVLSGWTDRPLHLVFGMMNTKAAPDFLRPLLPFSHSRHTVAVPGEEASLSAEEMATCAAAAGAPAIPHESLDDALRAIAGEAEQPGRVLICGSLYLAGCVLAENG